MGRLMADELAHSLSMRQALAIHLTSNHYPPVPTSMIEPCIEAIQACNEGDYDRQIDLPEGVSWRGKPQSPAHAIVEGHHLDCWIEAEGEPYDEECE
jgi:hypothetical protein